jgi:hypothetical protein
MPPQVCSSVVVRADLQTATQRINLVPGNSTDLTSHSRDSLAPGSTIDQVCLLSGVSVQGLTCTVAGYSSRGEGAGYTHTGV